MTSFVFQRVAIFHLSHGLVQGRALTPLFGNGAGAHGIGKISGVLTEIGKFDIILRYDVSIARMIPIIKLTLMYYEKREG